MDRPFSSRPRSHAYAVDGKIVGVPMTIGRGRVLLQQGPAREGRRRSRSDQDLGRLPRRGQDAQGGRHHADHHGRRREVADALLLVLPRHADRRRRRASSAAMARKTAGFTDAAFVEGRRASCKELAELEPFQDGWLGDLILQSARPCSATARAPSSSWATGSSARRRPNATDGKGIPEDKIGFSASRSWPAARASPPTRSAASNGWLITEGVAEGGARLPEVLLAGREPDGRRPSSGVLHARGRRHPDAITNPLIAPCRRERRRLDLSPDLLRPGSRTVGRPRGQRHLGRHRRGRA